MERSLNRRSFLKKSATTSVSIATAGVVAACGGSQSSTSQELILKADPGLASADVPTLQAAIKDGKLSSESLVRLYLERLQALDRSGPTLKAVLEINPDALEIAKALDANRSAAPRGPLYGIPVLLKDNIATGDKTNTTAGSLALAGVKAARDAFIVKRLRDAGAVILGKANLSEWANFRSTRGSSGWSARGGQTRNPHHLARNTSGSSSGSAAAAAASLCAVTVGTETDGSIISPAASCGVVGMKPTVGLVSRDGIIPIAAEQDTAGPMTRSVTDAAILLSVLAGTDARDPATAAATGKIGDYIGALKTQALQGARIGVIRGSSMPGTPAITPMFEAALVKLKSLGAVLVDGLEIPNTDKYGESEFTVLLTEFKALLPRYLAEFAPNAPIKDLAGLIAWNEANAATSMPIFGQELLAMAQQAGSLTSPEYLAALATSRRYSRTEGIDALFAEHKLDAVVAPTGDVVWMTDHILADRYMPGGFIGPFAVAGYPHLTVPMGFVQGMPVGISFAGLAFTEAKLLGYGFAYEQATKARRDPAFATS